jgi:bla regulator protein BlaR1
MSDWILQQALIISLAMCVLSFGQTILIRWFGGVGNYVLWLVVPILLMCSLIPWESLVFDQQNIKSYLLVLPTVESPISRLAENHDAVILCCWAMGILVLGSLVLAKHKSFIKQLNLKPINLGKDLAGLNSYQAAVGCTPFISGFLKPYLVVPDNFFSEYSAVQRRLILEHELCHYRRRDLVWNALANGVWLLFWFNPICWWSFKYFRQAQEIACDQTVLQGTTSSTRVAYGNAMLVNVSQRVSESPYLVNFGDKQTMLKRIEYMKTVRWSPQWRSVALFGALVTIISVLNTATAVQSTKEKEVEAIHKVSPKYPMSAAINGVEGYVVMSFTVTRLGEVKDVNVVESEPSNVFDEVSVAALQNWKYETSFKDHYNQRVQWDFKLDKSKPIKWVDDESDGKPTSKK